MILATVERGTGQSGPAVIEGPQCTLIEGVNSLDELIRKVPSGLGIAEFASSDAIPLDQVRLMAPLLHPGKLICIGLNYSDHAHEVGARAPEIPIVFSKFASAIIGPGEPIRLPAIATQVDYEAELVVVIGREGKNIPRDSALEHVFGYCCGNDVSSRDWQKGKPGRQWLLGKTFDTFAPLGPTIVTADEIADPQNLAIQLRLNGQTMQSSNTSQMIFPIDQLIEHVSKFFALEPGDLIFTGTPPGVGMGRDPQVFLQAGDRVEVEIEGLGVLSNPVQA
jgi:2-keto-4-pentenoate hydratase/2-oxohepta-3-ene-1,7-dioic acid hydratase in catechol pathway